MALIKCRECSREISDKAAACPGCGAPNGASNGTNASTHVTAKRAGGKWEGIGFILIVIGMVVAMAADGPVATIGGFAIVAGLVTFIFGRFN